MSLFSELQRRKVFRVTAGYVLASWVLIQVVETIFPAFGLDDEAFRLLVITLSIGLVPVVILSWALELTNKGLVPDRDARAEPASTESVSAVLKRPRFAVPLGLALLAAIVTIASLWMQLHGSKTARRELLPQIEALVDEGHLVDAYAIALAAEEHLPRDPVLAGLFDRLSVTMSFTTEPAGAEVSYRRYTPGDGEWVSLGVTPLESVRLPRAVLHWKFEKPGHEMALRAGESFNGTYRIALAEGDLASSMLRVPSADRYFVLTGYAIRDYHVPAFQVGRNEVTNTEFLQFVEDGGYNKPDNWAHLEFIEDGKTLSIEEAMDRFRDSTGRYGPSTWQGGRRPG